MYIIYTHTHTHTHTHCCCVPSLLSDSLWWSVACQAPLSVEFSRQEYGNGEPVLSPEDLPIPEIEPWSPALQADSLPLSYQGSPYTHTVYIYIDRYGLPRCSRGKEPTCQCRSWKICEFNPWVGKIPWRRARQPTSVFLPGKSHGQKRLGSYSP